MQPTSARKMYFVPRPKHVIECICNTHLTVVYYPMDISPPHLMCRLVDLYLFLICIVCIVYSIISIYTFIPISKVLETLIYKQITKDTSQQGWIPHHQFGFRRAHTTIQQCHRLAETIHKTIENHQYCTAVFLGISQAFDKVWHPGLLFKIKRTFVMGTVADGPPLPPM